MSACSAFRQTVGHETLDAQNDQRPKNVMPQVPEQNLGRGEKKIYIFMST
jgi:hypothetical protein